MERRDFPAGLCLCGISGAARSFSFGLDAGAGLLNPCRAPLPGVIALFSVDERVDRGWLANGAGEPVKRIREYNPLMFDFVLKRHIRIAGRRLGGRVFETARVFRRSPPAIFI